jgi:hypothetical protein
MMPVILGGSIVKAIKDFKIEIDKEKVRRNLGYENGHGPSSSISSLIDEEIDEAYSFIQPSCFYQIMDISRIRRPRVTLVNGTTLSITSEVLSWVLYPCKKAVIFVASIGEGLEERAVQLMEEGHLLKATLLDAIGSEATEKVACHLQERVRELANLEEAEITLRYSPGYCDWDITQQRVLFEAMNSAPISVDLTTECLMLPRKSISGIIGLGWGEKRRLRLSPCRFCPRQDCQNRR